MAAFQVFTEGLEPVLGNVGDLFYEWLVVFLVQFVEKAVRLLEAILGILFGGEGYVDWILQKKPDDESYFLKIEVLVRINVGNLLGVMNRSVGV
jgi:hypothetical protein